MCKLPVAHSSPRSPLPCFGRGLARAAATVHAQFTGPPAPSLAQTQDGYQKRYFALESFEAGAVELQAYCASLQAGLTDEVRAAVGLAS